MAIDRLIWLAVMIVTALATFTIGTWYLERGEKDHDD